MSRFIVNILIFTLSFFTIEKIFYIFLLISPRLEKDNRLEKVINGEISEEIIVFGSSRGARNIIAGQIEDSLNLSVYNLSYPGSNIEFHEFLLRSLIRFNKKPNTVLLAIDEPGELLQSESLKFRFDRLYPLAKYKYINNEMIARGEKSFLSKILILSRINKRNFDIRKKRFSAVDTIIECGSMPISFHREDRTFNFDNCAQHYQKKEELDSKVVAFLKFQDLCLENGIKLILVFSPNFHIPNSEFEQRIKQLTPRNVHYFIYNTTNGIYKNKSYYYDEGHLAINGAVIFTNELIEFLRVEIIRAQNPMMSFGIIPDIKINFSHK